MQSSAAVKGKSVVPEWYEDQLTGEVYSRGDLQAQYQGYVDELRDELPDVQSCSFPDWLRGELEDRLQVHVPASGGNDKAE